MHPDTGKPYTWTDADLGLEPLALPLADLPEVTPDQLRAFARQVSVSLVLLDYDDVKISDRGDPQRRAAYSAERAEGDPVSPGLLIKLLGQLCDPHMERDDWYPIIAAIRSTNLRGVADADMDDELLEIACAWSRGDYTEGVQPGNYTSDDDVETVFGSFDPDAAGGARFGSIVHAARAAGYTGSLTDIAKWQEVINRLRAEGKIPDPEPEAEPEQEPAEPRTGHRVVLMSGADVDPETISWLWRGHYALGKLHVLAGKPEAGKNLITISTAATLSVGGNWPDGTQAPVGDTLFWSGEDAFKDTTLPRFMAAGGDRRRIHVVRTVLDDDGNKRPFDPARDVPDLCEAMRALPDLRYLVIDPIAVVVAGGKGASNNNAETRRALQPLVDLAEERGIVVEGVTHFAKDSGKRDVLERVIESTAFTAVARLVHVAHRFEDDDDKPRRWVRIKGNIVKRSGDSVVGYEYDPIDSDVPGFPGMMAPRLKWSEPLRGTPRSLIAEAPTGRPTAELDDAVAWLKAYLQAGGEQGVELRELRPAAEAHCHAWRTVERAKELLGVKSKQNLGASHAGWCWVLPPESEEPIPY
jgi:putative DNA primase/helicase